MVSLYLLYYAASEKSKDRIKLFGEGKFLFKNKTLRRWLAFLEVDFKSLPQAKKQTPKRVPVFWRSGRDLNPRAAFDGNTISSRARYDHFDTTAYEIALCNTAKIIIPNSTGLSSKKTEKLHVFSWT